MRCYGLVWADFVSLRLCFLNFPGFSYPRMYWELINRTGIPWLTKVGAPQCSPTRVRASEQETSCSSFSEVLEQHPSTFFHLTIGVVWGLVIEHYSDRVLLLGILLFLNPHVSPFLIGIKKENQELTNVKYFPPANNVPPHLLLLLLWLF